MEADAPTTLGTVEVIPQVPDYKLFRRIGTGAYGDVWLGQNRLGAYRAIKVVHRSRFADARPYEREYEGLQNFAEISRDHDGLVDILHMGRDDQQEYFYYVMELGDDREAGQQISPDTYTTRTLQSELNRRGAIPFGECLRISLSVLGALGFMHKRKLVHRDIKPANIIFVHGAAKVADIGLVTEMNSDATWVGTPMFMDPVLHGSPQGDLFAFAKVLSAMISGTDAAGPSALPATTSAEGYERRLRELKAVVAKACSDDLRERYESAEDIYAHLALIQAGKSIRRLVALDRWLVAGRRYALSATVVLLLSGIILYQLNQQQKQAAELRQRQVGSFVAYGTRAGEEGDLLASLPWFLAALQLEENNPEKSKAHRLRIASVLSQSPRIVQFWSHDRRIDYAEFAADGRQILAPGPDGRIALWDLAGGEAVSPPLGRGLDQDQGSLSPDGRTLVICGGDGSAQVLDWASGRERFSLSHGETIYSARFSPNGERIITTARGDDKASIWDARTGSRLARLEGHRHTVQHAVFSPDGRRVVTSGRDSQAIVWDAAMGGALATFTGHTGWVYYAAFSPDSQWVASGSYDRSARVWEAGTGREVLKIPHNAAVRSIEFSADGERLVTACWDSTARIWNRRTGEALGPPLQHDSKVMYACFSPDGRLVLTVCADGAIRVWKLPVAPELQPSPTMVWSADGLRVATMTNGTVRLRDTDTGRDIVIYSNATESISSILPNRDGSAVLILASPVAGTATNRLEARLWDGTTAGLPGSGFDLDTAFRDVVLSENGRRAAATDRQTILVVDTLRGEGWTNRLAGPGEVRQMVFDHASTRLAVACSNAVQIFDAATGRPLLPVPLALHTLVTHIEFSPDDRLLVTACADSRLDAEAARLWDAATGRPVGTPMPHRDGVLCATFSPDGRRIVTSSEDFTAMIWDAATGRPVGGPLRHADEVTSAAFSEDGRWIITSGREGVARVWEAETGEPLTLPFKHGVRLIRARFLEHGRSIFAESRDGRRWQWELPQEERTVADLSLIVRLLSAGRGHSTESMTSASGESRLHGWQVLHEKYPGEFSVRPPGGTPASVRP